MQVSNTLTTNASTMVSLTKHQMAGHEGIKYLCRQCGKQFSKRVFLSEQQRAVQKFTSHNLLEYKTKKRSTANKGIVPPQA